MNDWLDHLSSTTSLWETLGRPEASVVLLCMIALAGVLTRVPFARRKSGRRRSWSPRIIRPSAPIDVSDPKRQMEFISRVEFEPQPLLNKSEYQVLILLESVVRDLSAGYRVMAQTSLGEILRPKKGRCNTADADLAYRAINSKRADFVVVDRRGIAVLAVEYQGHGHYQGNAFMRDAVKREVFRKANVALLEVPADFANDDVAAQVRSILEGHRPFQPACVVSPCPTTGRASQQKRYLGD